MSPPTVLAGVFILSALPFLAVELFPSRLYRVMDTASYLVFHNAAEFFSIMVSLSIFGIGWYTYEQSTDRHALFLSSAFFAIGLIDFMHAMGYAGMPAFITPNSANKSTQFWIAARCISAAAFFGSAYIYRDGPGRWLSKPILMTTALVISGTTFVAITFFPSHLPATFIEGVGLTPFKKISEYLIIGLLLLAMAAYWKRMSTTGDTLLIYYLAAFILCIFSELVFAIYKSVFDTYNVLGHVYKVAAFFLIYKGIFAASVMAPYVRLVDASERLMTDVIELKRAEEDKSKMEAQLRQAQKMEAVGQLSGGIAHDFNNILTAIIGYGHLLLMKMAKDDPLRVNVAQILEAADRAAILTHSLLAFSRNQIINVKPVAINGLISKVEAFLRRIIGEDIELRTVLSGREHVVMVDSGQIEQALVNLATNARDAMPKGGVLTIETMLIEIDSGFVQSHGYGVPGSYVIVSVSDTGTGIDEETRKKIFDPFFTTKEQGKGTGLGLSMVYGIIKQHGGYINVYSELERGATFKIYLPIATIPAEEKRMTEEADETEGGSETILVAEDDAALRKLFGDVLEEFGYTVITAADGQEAITRFNANRDKIRLCILDLIMPIKGGGEVYDEIRTMNPDIGVIFASGYTADKIYKEGILTEGPEIILKPVSPTDLLKKVRQVLDGKPNS